ncbi:VIT and vWA domain-containing protein [Jannaschia aquimarina]|uniref:Vault protein inter-alpha-trypsin n=1 Tax=Jannaschia aquimarina TaxID=935700 RepID=A0A0D1DAT4_9RHOB|nr:VIT and VWA domain-containing protein [Jannaschia aquimarina]KIT17053.1 Vault protein inter-alpha-trypsin [Jannaschia aquimarina]SNS82362.1 Ca-activated chloride channel family protein [Jannaschia aquimarina]
MTRTALFATSAFVSAMAAATVMAPSPVEAAGLLTPAGSTQSLTLADHEVTVVLEDGYAITTIEQRFANPGAFAAEAHYSFPVPDKAAVSEFTYWIDGKPVVGEVVERERGRQIYEGERAAGREAAIAEQDAHYAFDMRVTPVPAGGDVMVRLTYIQPARLEGGIGRYAYPLERQSTNEDRIAFWDMTETVAGRFAFEMDLRTDYPIEAVRLPAHPDARTERTADGWRISLGDGRNVLGLPAPLSDGTAPELTDAAFDPAADAEWATLGGEEIALDGAPATENAAEIENSALQARRTAPSAATRLDTDIVLYWRQAADQPARVDLVPYKAEAGERGTFMLTLTPGMDLGPIEGGRDFAFVLDVSGSMDGKIATLGEGVARALASLTPEDRFSISTFNDGAKDLTGGLIQATPDAIARWSQTARTLPPGGGTNLYAGLDMGLRGLDADRTGAVVLVTDGEANVGVTETQKFMDLVRGQDVRLFTAVMGNGANRPLLEPMTRLSGGTSVAVSNSDDIQGVLVEAASKVGFEALNGLNVALDPVDGDVRIADIEAEDIRTLYRGEQLSLLGHYWGAGDVRVTLTGEIAGEAVSYTTTLPLPETALRNPEIERLWAFQAIETRMERMALLGEDADANSAVIDLSVENGVLTPLTAMIALREERFEELGIERRNRDRVEIETAAAEQRASAPVRTTRVDTGQPMFQAPAPTATRSSGGSGGSGNIGLLGMVLAGLAGLAGGLGRRRSGDRS